jgi:hypothetical protein
MLGQDARGSAALGTVVQTLETNSVQNTADGTIDPHPGPFTRQQIRHEHGLRAVPSYSPSIVAEPSDRDLGDLIHGTDGQAQSIQTLTRHAKGRYTLAGETT